jgi:hypothetical protein
MEYEEIPSAAQDVDGSKFIKMVKEQFDSVEKQKDTLKKLAALGQGLDLAERLQTAIEEQLVYVKGLVFLAQYKLIPDLMDEAEVPFFGLKDGSEVNVVSDVKANITKERRAAALDWLIEKGHSGVIKWEVSLPLDKGTSPADVKRHMAELKALGYAPTDESTVHAQTLSALARELLEAGTDLNERSEAMKERNDERTPAQLIGLFHRRKAVIVKAKTKKTRKKK